MPKPKGFKFCRCLSRMYWTNLTKCSGYMGGYHQSNLPCRDQSWDIAKVTDCWHKSTIIGTPPSFCALAFHNRWEDRNTDACLNITNVSSTSHKNLLNFGPITSQLFRCDVHRVSKKTSTHIIGYKLRNSCLILIIFGIKIPHIIWHRMTA